jgi:hypothetical protein
LSEVAKHIQAWRGQCTKSCDLHRNGSVPKSLVSCIVDHNF